MKRVVHVSTVHHPSDVRIFRKECSSLLKAGYEVHLLGRGVLEDSNGIIMHTVEGDQGILNRIKAQKGLLKKLLAIGGDLYHFHDPELLPIASRLKSEVGVPVIFDKHESTRGKKGVRKAAALLENRFLSKMDRVVIAESSYKNELPEDCPPAIEVLNYYKEGDIQPRDRSERKVGDRLRLIYTGFASRARGLDRMLDLAEDLEREDISFTITIAGQCQIADDRLWMESQVKERGLFGFFNFVGWTDYISQKEIEETLLTADLGLCLLDPLPNYLESIPTKFYEYMHFGLPVICSDFPLWKSFIEENPFGICVGPADRSGLLKAVVEASQVDRFNLLSENAKDLSKKYRWEIMEKNLLEMYNDLLF